jgi:hypothetical protein
VRVLGCGHKGREANDDMQGAAFALGAAAIDCRLLLRGNEVSALWSYGPEMVTAKSQRLTHARELARTPAFANSQRERKKVEALFAELKNQIGLRRLRLRRMKFVREQFFLAAAAQNIKRLVRFLSQRGRPPLAVTA